MSRQHAAGSSYRAVQQYKAEQQNAALAQQRYEPSSSAASSIGPSLPPGIAEAQAAAAAAGAFDMEKQSVAGIPRHIATSSMAMHQQAGPPRGMPMQMAGPPMQMPPVQMPGIAMPMPGVVPQSALPPGWGAAAQMRMPLPMPAGFVPPGMMRPPGMPGMPPMVNHQMVPRMAASAAGMALMPRARPAAAAPAKRKAVPAKPKAPSGDDLLASFLDGIDEPATKRVASVPHGAVVSSAPVRVQARVSAPENLQMARDRMMMQQRQNAPSQAAVVAAAAAAAEQNAAQSAAMRPAVAAAAPAARAPAALPDQFVQGGNSRATDGTVDNRPAWMKNMPAGAAEAAAAGSNPTAHAGDLHRQMMGGGAVGGAAAPKKAPKLQPNRTAAGKSWHDATLAEWNENDFRIFVGDLGNEVDDATLAGAFKQFPSFLKAKVVRDKRTTKSKGFGFVSLGDAHDYARAIKEVNGTYVGNRPCKLRKSDWAERAKVAKPQGRKGKKGKGKQ